MKRTIPILFIIIRLALGALMLVGGISKLTQTMPAPTEVFNIDEEKKAEFLEEKHELQIHNYMFGLRQTNYFWQFLAICEILGGILLISQIFSFPGAVILLPITLHIFLMHLFLEYEEPGEVFETAVIFLANVALIAREYPRWKHLLRIRVFPENS